MELKVYNTAGAETGRSASLDVTVFGIEPNDHGIYLDVKQYLAAQRQGTHKSKQKNEVSGSTRKLFRQKGTGGARAGSIKSPLRPGGGRVFGPVPRDYSFKLNKKLKQLARRSALTYKAQGEAIVVVEDFTMDVPKTKGFIAIAEALKSNVRGALLVLGQSDYNVMKSVANLPDFKVAIADTLNTYDVMRARKLVMTESAVETINALLGKE